MRLSPFKFAAAAAIMAPIAFSSARADILPVKNLTFTDYSGVAPKAKFSAVNPGDWFRGPAAGLDDLVFIDAPNTATTSNYSVYGPFPNPPSGGNFVQADGNPDYESVFRQSISGLDVGTTYSLSFWQAAGQQVTFSGTTTEQWRVFLGNNANFFLDDERDSPVMNTPSKGVSAWNLVDMSFTASATSETLTFLAWGNGGSTVNLPPTVFLAGVNSPALSMSEPLTGLIFATGLAWLLRMQRRKPAKA